MRNKEKSEIPEAVKQYTYIEKTALISMLALTILALKLPQKFKRTYQKISLRKEYNDYSHIDDFDKAFSASRKNTDKIFLRTTKDGTLKKYTTKLLEEVFPEAKVHREDFNIWVRDFFNRPTVIKTFSQTTSLDKEKVKRILQYRLDSLPIKEHLAQTTNNDKFGFYRYETGDLYAEFSTELSGYPHEKFHSIDFGIECKNKEDIILSEKMNRHLKAMINADMIEKIDQITNTEHKKYMKNITSGYLLEHYEMFSRIMTLVWTIELSSPKHILSDHNFIFTKETLDATPFNEDVTALLLFINKEKMLYFINSLYGKETLYHEYISSQSKDQQISQ